MVNILIDTNVAVDFVACRQPFYEASEKIILLAKSPDIDAYVSAAAVTDVYYISRRELKNKNLTLKLLKNFLTIVKVATVTEKEIAWAINSSWRDFEDAVQYSVALSNKIDYIITRNAEDFSESEISVVTPENFCKMLIEDKIM